jgi:REP element-mobilizing transposase RayT
VFGYACHVIWNPTYREQVERLERGGINTIGKEHFTSLFSPARAKAFTAKNIKAGFAASGLFPFNPDRVLDSMPRPAIGHFTVSTADKVIVETSSQEQIPPTPVTPVSAEGLMSLQNLIIEQDAHALDEKSKQSLQRHLRKFSKAAQLSFAKGALQQNHIRLLLKVNDEAKVRRSTKLLVLGTAKVMGYEELRDARAKRAEMEAAEETKAKGKRGRKRTKASSEADATQPKRKIARARERLAPPQASVPSSSVPVARMY